jgi:leucyl-tRNA synthetase
MARPFDVTAVEEKWQARWLEDGTYEVDNDDPRERFYALCMYPYPSGAAHQGHVRNYTFGDLGGSLPDHARQAVLSPIGFDSFGLPAENAAIKAGSHPRLFTDARMNELKFVASTPRRRLRLAPRGLQPRPRVHEWSQTIFLAFWKRAWRTAPRPR